MQLYQIRYFLAICQTGSVSQAARLCNVSQPSMSRAIKKLEHEIGDTLLVRNAKGVRLTPMGEEMEPYFRSMIDLEGELLDRVKSRQQEREANLRLGVMTTLGTGMIQPYMSRLMALSRDGRVQVIDAAGHVLHQMMEDGALDLCLTGTFTSPANADVYPLYNERYLISFAKGHKFEARQAISFADLDGEPYIRRVDCELRTGLFDMPDHVPKPEVDVRFESQQENMVQLMVLSGAGCCVHPETMPVLEGILQRPFTDADLSRSVRLLVRSPGPSPILTRRIIRMTQTHFAGVT